MKFKLLLGFLLCAGTVFGQTTVLPKTTILPKTTVIAGGASGSPTVSLINSGDNGSGSLLATLTLPVPNTLSSTRGVVIHCVTPSSSTSTVTITDTGSNTYQLDATNTFTGYADIERFYSAYLTSAISAGGHVSIALSNGTSEGWYCELLSLSALLSSSWYDQGAVDNNSYGTTQSSGTTSATSNANDFSVISFTGQSSGWGTVTFNGSYTRLDNPDWTASYAYNAGAFVKPLLNNAGGYTYEVTTAGTSSGTEPATWNQTVAGTQSDGTVTWTNRGEGVGSYFILNGGRTFTSGWKALSATGTQNGTIGITSSDNTNGMIATYKQ